ncbi:MAG: radical SAM protein [Candidatus Omnitrophota bacterium]|nr:radical SAM protein [Candidatus Omnitrophota bacterium]
MLRAKSALLGRPLIGPKSVNIHAIQACDRKCAFCWYFSPLISSPPKRVMLDYKVLEGVIEDCHEIGVDEINLEGGEIVLYPFAEQAFRKVKELGMKLRAYSHLDFDSKHLQYLCLADRLIVNLSAMTEESYRRIHGKASGSLENLLKHLDRLLVSRRKYGKPKIVLTFIVYDHNYKEMPAFLDLAQQRGVDRVYIRFFKATEEMKELVFSNDSLSALREIVETALGVGYTFEHNLENLRNIVVHGHQLENIVALKPTPMNNDRLLVYDATGGEKVHCQVGWFYSYIDENGQVVAPCDGVGVCVAGNVNERRYKAIWFDNDYLHNTLREASAGIHACSSKWRECRHCSYVPVNKFLNEKVVRARGSEKT